MTQRLLSALWLLWISLSVAAAATENAERIASLIDPAKLATLKSRGANQRLHKIVYQLEMAQREGANLATVIDEAARLAGITNPAQLKLIREALLRNRTIAQRMGCLDADGLEQMKHGHSPTVRKGPCKGDELSVDHIIPIAVCPELDPVIANLELMPLRLNERKQATVGQRQLDVGEKLYAAGLLTKKGLKKIRQASKPSEQSAR